VLAVGGMAAFEEGCYLGGGLQAGR